MKIILSFLILFFPYSHACTFKKDVIRIYSLSGPVSFALAEYGLLRDKRVVGLSVFNPVDARIYKGEFLPGGVFLSRNILQKMKGSLVFYDESRELRRMISSFESVRSIEIKTRGDDPEATTQKITQLLSQYTSHCENEAQNLLMRSKKLSQEILSLIPKKLAALFFLGKLSSQKRPELVIVQDGIIRWLIQKDKLLTYPSELSYVSWSAKVMQTLPTDTLEIGVEDSGNRNEKQVRKLGSQKYNMIYPGALVPGVSQQEAWLYLLKNL